MPEVAKSFEAAKPKTQPWRAYWPPARSSATFDEQLNRKAKGGTSVGSGLSGYDDNDECTLEK